MEPPKGRPPAAVVITSVVRIGLLFPLLITSAWPQSAPGSPNQSNAQPDSSSGAATVESLQRTLTQTRVDLNQARQEIEELKLRLSQLETLVSGGQSPRQQTTASGDAFPTTPAAAASSAEPPPDVQSLAEQQAVLASRVEEHDQTKVESASRYKVRLHGLILMNAFSNSGKVDLQDVPNLVFGNTPGQSNGIFGATLRQTSIGLEAFGPTIAGAKTHATVDVDFFGGFPDTQYGTTAGLVRLRTADARFDWKTTSVVAGQDVPFFSPLSPTSYASVGEPALSWAGNLWTWTPQVRAEHRWTWSDNSGVTWQGGILDPLTEQMPSDYTEPAPTAGEQSHQPAIATRMAVSTAIFNRPIVLGAGAYHARQDYGFGRTIDAWAGTVDWSIPLGQKTDLSGEYYRGRGVGGLGGGIWTSVIYDGDPTASATQLLGLGSMGGWMQLKFRPLDRLELNAAAGTDNPLSEDLERFSHPLTAELFPPLARNQSAFLNAIFKPRSNLILALEYRHLRSYTLRGLARNADHVNLAIGFSF